MSKASRKIVFTHPSPTEIWCRVSYDKQKKREPMKRKHYDTDYAAICDVARWDEHIMKGNNPFSFGATTTTPDGSSRSGNARQKAESKRLYDREERRLYLHPNPW